MDRKKLERLVWSNTHRDFRGRDADGTKTVLYLNPSTGGTERWPVSALPMDALLRKLPAAVRVTLEGA